MVLLFNKKNMKAENLHMCLVSARDRVGSNEKKELRKRTINTDHPLRSFAIKRNINRVIIEEGYEVKRGDFLLRSEISHRV